MLRKVLFSLAIAAAALFTASQAHAQVPVRGYYRSSGTYVQPYYRSIPDGNFYNNWSTYPNVNPYSGQMGTRLTPSYGGGYGGSGSLGSGYRSLYSPSRSSWGW